MPLSKGILEQNVWLPSRGRSFCSSLCLGKRKVKILLTPQERQGASCSPESQAWGPLHAVLLQPSKELLLSTA